MGSFSFISTHLTQQLFAFFPNTNETTEQDVTFYENEHFLALYSHLWFPLHENPSSHSSVQTINYKKWSWNITLEWKELCLSAMWIHNQAVR